MVGVRETYEGVGGEFEGVGIGLGMVLLILGGAGRDGHGHTVRQLEQLGQKSSIVVGPPRRESESAMRCQTRPYTEV